MYDAKLLYEDILRALALVLPRAIYRDVRRVRTLAWAMTGLCLTRQVHLSAWASLRQSRSQQASLRERSFSYWLHQASIVPSAWYGPAIQAALSSWPSTLRRFVALDTTVIHPFVVIRASLLYRGRAIPLAWRVLRKSSAQISFAEYEPVLLSLCALLSGRQLTLLADRGFAHRALLQTLQEHHAHFRLRLPSDTLIHLHDQWVVPVKALCPQPGQARFVHEARLFHSGEGPVSLVLATPLQTQEDPWCVASSEPASAQTLEDYRLRFHIEHSFRDDKTGGFQLQATRLTSPAALERLLLILVLTTLYVTSLGTRIAATGKRPWVDPHWERGLSYLQLGMRGLRQQIQHDWQTSVPFQLDPDPDPLPRQERPPWSEPDDLPTAA